MQKFSVGDIVWVLNTKTEKYLILIGLDQLTIIEKHGHEVYRIRFDNGTERMYHTNILKSHVSRDSKTAVGGKEIQESDIQSDSDELNLDGVGTSTAVMELIEAPDSADGDDDDESVSYN